MIDHTHVHEAYKILKVRTDEAWKHHSSDFD